MFIAIINGTPHTIDADRSVVTLDGPGVRELVRLLGDDYGRVTFDIIDDRVTLHGCRIVEFYPGAGRARIDVLSQSLA